MLSATGLIFSGIKRTLLFQKKIHLCWNGELPWELKRNITYSPDGQCWDCYPGTLSFQSNWVTMETRSSNDLQLVTWRGWQGIRIVFPEMITLVICHMHAKSFFSALKVLTRLPLDKMATILPDDIFKCILLNENEKIPIPLSLKLVPSSPIDNKPALVQVMAWHRTGDMPLPEPTMTLFADAYFRH